MMEVVLLAVMKKILFDPSTSNFNEEGDCDYPSIPIAGCTDPTAIGYYNPVATIDNGTCPNIDEPPIDPVTKEINQVIGRIFDDTSSQAETYKDIAIIGLCFLRCGRSSLTEQLSFL